MTVAALATTLRVAAQTAHNWLVPPACRRRYDLNLWIGHPLEGATYLPR